MAFGFLAGIAASLLASRLPDGGEKENEPAG